MSSENTEQAQWVDEFNVRPSLDLAMVGDNVGQIARFTLEKYEFANSVTLSHEEREAAIQKIEDALWKAVERIRNRRRDMLAAMFRLASETLEESLKSNE